jgi:hypothetical protein
MAIKYYGIRLRRTNANKHRGEPVPEQLHARQPPNRRIVRVAREERPADELGHREAWVPKEAAARWLKQKDQPGGE